MLLFSQGSMSCCGSRPLFSSFFLNSNSPEYESCLTASLHKTQHMQSIHEQKYSWPQCSPSAKIEKFRNTDFFASFHPCFCTIQHDIWSVTATLGIWAEFQTERVWITHRYFPDASTKMDDFTATLECLCDLHDLFFHKNTENVIHNQILMLWKRFHLKENVNY